MFSAIRVVNRHVFRLNDQITSLRHGVFGIQGQVHQYLLYLGWVAIDGSESFAGPGFDLNHFWYGA
jgi:hypothetical protein